MIEKAQTIKKTNRLLEILSSKRAKVIIGTILLSGIGVALPRIFHVLAGSSAGTTFLPMHIAVLIAALTFGAFSGSVVAGVSIVFSFLLTGMPTLARLPYMLVELVIYAVLLGNLNKKFHPYVSLIVTIILGRIIYSAVLWGAINLFGLPTYGISVMESIRAGIPGTAIQLICVPFIAKCIKKGIRYE